MRKIEEYWKSNYSNKKLVESESLQKNVGRTKNGEVISIENWNSTIDYISNLLSINSNSKILELCCGNGQLLGPLSKISKSANGVDFSEYLLDQLKREYGDSIKTILCDVMSVDFQSKFDIIINYFSIQHFSEKNTVLLIEKSLSWLKKGGKIFIGDIPNELKKWEYIQESEHKRDFFSRLVVNKPMIGTWFQPDFFKSMSCYFENIKVEILTQPSFQINSAYRFDVLITKI